jgi:hypothetical protein
LPDGVLVLTKEEPIAEALKPEPLGGPLFDPTLDIHNYQIHYCNK